MFTQDTFTMFAFCVSALVLLTLYFGQRSDSRIRNKTNKSIRNKKSMFSPAVKQTTDVKGQEAKAFQVKTWNQASTKKALSGNYDIKSVGLMTNAKKNQ